MIQKEVTPNNSVIDDIVFLEPCNLIDIGKYTKIFNKDSIGRVIRVHLDPNQCRWCLQDVQDLKTHESVHPGTVEWESNTWLTLFSNELDLTAGQHIYKLVFYNPAEYVEIYQYISYIIQTADVEKPYIYIKRESES